MINKKEYWIFDWIKVILAIFVLIRHCYQNFQNSLNIVSYVFVNYISTIAVPMFFVISSYLFYIKKRKIGDLKKRIAKILTIYIIWTIIYFPIIILKSDIKSFFTIKSLIITLRDFLFNGLVYHLWFFPALIISLLLSFLLIKKCNLRKLLFLGVILYIIGTLIDTYIVIPQLLITRSYKIVFVTTRNGLFYGLPFFIVGYYLATDNNLSKYNNTKLVIISVIALALSIIELTLQIKYYPTKIVNMNFSSLIIAFCLMIWLIKVNESWNRFKTKNELRKISMLIYLIHPLIIYAVKYLNKFLELNLAISIFLTMLLTFIFSILFVKLSKRVRLLQNFY